MAPTADQIFETVTDALTWIECDHGVDVVLGVARGSHAWGAANSDSEYDVGFVYVANDLRRYAHLEGPSEVILEQRDEFEFQGWDVRTFARLLADSNVGAIDLLRSPIRYRAAYAPADLAAYVERTYNPMDLYHAWRGIAVTNYRTYVSHHLVRPDDVTVPIVDARESEYRVETEEGTMTVPADDERFTESRTRSTVRRNLKVTRAAMSARYLKATGERGDHELPALEFETFLTEQAPAVFDRTRIDRAWELLERTRAGDGGATISDAVGREFAHPPREIDPEIHARSGPDTGRLDEFVDEMIDAVQ